jgi:5-methylcytosine-specific restriction endonuclease McrA
MQESREQRRQIYNRKLTANKRFRSSGRWKDKSLAIRTEDNFLCLECRHNGRYVSGVEVHHIVPLSVDVDKGLDDDNLITLCRDCHEKAECGELSREHLRSLVRMYRYPPTL